MLTYVVRNVKCFAFASLMPSRSSKNRRLLSTSEMRLANSGNSEIVFTTQRQGSIWVLIGIRVGKTLPKDIARGVIISINKNAMIYFIV